MGSDVWALNDAAIVAEVRAVHDEYEHALVTNDVAVLDRMFWHSPHALRFGVMESLYGYEEIAAFRKSRPAIDLARTVSNLTIVTFGRDVAVTTLEFDRVAFNAPRHGRQTQVWKRFHEGWRIVSAHVSFAWETGAYVDAASALIGLSIPRDLKPGVALNVTRAQTIAQPLLAFDLPDTVEMAPVFEP